MEPRQLPVQVKKSCREAGDHAFALVERIDHLDGALDDVFHRHSIRLQLPRGDIKDQRLRFVQEMVRIHGAVIAVARNRGRRADEVAEDRLLLDNATVVSRIGRRGHETGERGKVAGPANGLKQILAFELLGDRDEVDGDRALVEAHNGGEDLAVTVLVERRLLQDLGGLDDGLFLKQHRAHHRLLRIEILRGEPFKCGQLR